MDITMTKWYSLLKHKIIKDNDDLEEGDAWLNEADIANWFKTLEQTFEEMLSGISVGDTDELVDSGMGFRLNRIESENKRQIKILGNQIAADILTAGMETWVTESAEFEDDSVRSISHILGSDEYNIILNALYAGAETAISTIFDTAYEGVKTQYDDPKWKPDEEEAAPIPTDESLTEEIIEIVWDICGQPIVEDIKITEAAIINEIEKESKVPAEQKKEVGEKVAAAVMKEIKEELMDPIKKLTAYVFQSFMIKYPQSLKVIEQSPETDQSVMPPDTALEIEDEDEYERRRKEFEEENLSEYNGEYIGELDWQSVLSKRAGTGLTSGASFSPAVHHMNYGKKPCKNCMNKKSNCGCD